MICVCYKGIGKSTLSKKYAKAIDLDLSLFKGNYKIYTDVAKALSHQGNIVLVDCDREVRNLLRKSNEPFVTITPSREMEDKWKGFDSGLVNDLLCERKCLILGSLLYSLEDILPLRRVSFYAKIDGEEEMTYVMVNEENGRIFKKDKVMDTWVEVDKVCYLS